MEITQAFLELQKAQLTRRRDGALAQLNAVGGALEIVEVLLKQLAAPETVSAPKVEQP